MKDEQLNRYSRHILLPEVDVEGQQKILAARVLIVGLGGLGSPVAMYLAAAGVGHLLLADFDDVDVSNLQRQIAHSQATLGQRKVRSARQRLLELNPDVQCRLLEGRLGDNELDGLLASVDVVVDCSDNLSTRLQLNRACVKHKIALVSGAAIGMEGQLSVFDFSRSVSPCYACIYEGADDTLSCSESGVIAPLVGVIGSLQALEVLKLIVGLPGQAGLLLYDAKRAQWQSLGIAARSDCQVCSAR